MLIFADTIHRYKTDIPAFLLAAAVANLLPDASNYVPDNDAFV
jgi:hypothetical protein